MDSRFIILIIFLMFLITMTLAFPSEGTDDLIPDLDFFEELSCYALGEWTYHGPQLIDHASSTFVLEGSQPASPDLSHKADGGISPLGRHECTSDEAASRSRFQYPDPGPASQHPYHGLRELECPPDTTQVQDLTAETIGQLDAEQPVLGEDGLMDWIAGSYTTGQRVQPADFLDPSNHTQAMPSSSQTRVTRVRSLAPAPIQQSNRPPSDARTTTGPLRCYHDGCRVTCATAEDLRHHRRYHIPNAQRPHPCPYCHQRFLCPREVQRHLPVHGLGRHFYCHVPTCRWATKGFGRRDHLLRHCRKKHPAN